MFNSSDVSARRWIYIHIYMLICYFCEWAVLNQIILVHLQKMKQGSFLPRGMTSVPWRNRKRRELDAVKMSFITEMCEIQIKLSVSLK